MRKFRNLSYIFLIIIIAVLSVIIYSTIVKGSSEKGDKDKALLEVEFLDNKLGTLLNQLNNLETRNYNVSVSKIEKQGDEQKSNQGKKESGGNSDSGSSGEEDTQSEESSSSKGGSTENDTEQSGETNKKFEMKQSGILVNSNEIDWNNIKSEVETLYSTIPTITLDLYEVNVSQDDVLGFNKEFDKAVVTIKDEDKVGALTELSTLYEYIPKFFKKTTEDKTVQKISEVKTNLYKAYSKLDEQNWDEIKSDIKESINTYSQLLTETDISDNKQYNISKGYVMLNELQNATEIEDEAVFLIKYKNLLEEINNF